MSDSTSNYLYSFGHTTLVLFLCGSSEKVNFVMGTVRGNVASLVMIDLVPIYAVVSLL